MKPLEERFDEEFSKKLHSKKVWFSDRYHIKTFIRREIIRHLKMVKDKLPKPWETSFYTEHASEEQIVSEKQIREKYYQEVLNKIEEIKKEL